MAISTKKDRKAVLGLIEQIWNENPNLRLTQLLQNAFWPGDLYYVENHELIKHLKECYYGVNR